MLADYDPADVLAQLDEGITIPARWYTDDAVFAVERDRIFRHAWHHACPADRVRQPGDYFAYQYAGIPLVVVRGQDAVLRAFVNVCRHRGHEVASGCGNGKFLKCPNHQWAYSLDGSLRGAPRVFKEPGFDGSELSLVEVSVKELDPLVFVSARADAEPIDAELAHLHDMLARTGLDIDELAFDQHITWEMAGNWKIALENYLECYHCTANHKSFCQVMGSRDGDMELGVTGELFWGIMLRQGEMAPEDEPYPLSGPVRDFTISYLWPGVTISSFIGPPNLVVSNWDPTSPRMSQRQSVWYFGRDVPDETKARMKSWLEELGAEDISIVESMNRGIGSGAVETGRIYDEDDLVGEFQKRLTRAFLDAEQHGASSVPSRTT